MSTVQINPAAVEELTMAEITCRAGYGRRLETF